MERVEFRIPEDDLDRLDDYVDASASHDDRSSAIREAIRRLVDARYHD